MSRPRSSLAPYLVLFLAAPSARAGAVLDVSGEVVARVPRLEVRVVVVNRGDQPAVPLDVVGELFAEQREARVAGGVPPGEEAAVVLDFEPAPARPGLHALTLLLEHPVSGAPDAAGNPPLASQRAYLLLALGANPGPAVRIDVECAGEDGCAIPVGVKGVVTARLESTDSETHQVSVHALTARGLRADGPPTKARVSPEGPVTVRIPLTRSGATRGTRHGILVVAEKTDGPLARTAVATASVEVVSDPALLPRLRWPLLVLGLGLIGAAGAAEWRRRRSLIDAPP